MIRRSNVELMRISFSRTLHRTLDRPDEGSRVRIYDLVYVSGTIGQVRIDVKRISMRRRLRASGSCRATTVYADIARLTRRAQGHPADPADGRARP